MEPGFTFTLIFKCSRTHSDRSIHTRVISVSRTDLFLFHSHKFIENPDLLRHYQCYNKPTNGGNIAITAVMGPDSNSFGGLSPVNPATTLKGAYPGRNDMSAPFYDLMSDTGESLTVDVWNIFVVQGLLKHQTLLQFKIVNNSGDISTIETAFMRLV